MKKYLLYIYLGLALDIFAHINFSNWEFYAIIIPVAILDTIANYKTNQP